MHQDTTLHVYVIIVYKFEHWNIFSYEQANTQESSPVTEFNVMYRWVISLCRLCCTTVKLQI